MNRFNLGLAPLIICALAYCFTSTAQLEEPNYLFGDTYTVAVTDSASLEGVGPGQVWDWSNQVSSSDVLVVMHDPASTVFGKDYGYSNVMQANVNGEYYYGTTDSLTFYGGMEDGFSYPYSDPETYFPYPFALGETWADSSSMSYTVSVITVIRTGSLESSCTATGSITLPGGAVYDDCYKIHFEQTLMDSTGFGNITRITSGDYIYAQGLLPPLAVAYQTTTIDDDLGTGEPVITEASGYQYLAQYVLDVPGEELGIHGLPDVQVFPNPAAEQAFVTWSSEHEPEFIRVLDMQGRLVHESRPGAGSQKVSLDVSDWTPGVYLVDLGVNTSPQRLTVQ